MSGQMVWFDDSLGLLGDLARDDNEPMCVFCCDPNITLCGRDCSDEPVSPADAETTCVVCEDLENFPCEVTCSVTARVHAFIRDSSPT